jgi:hypothetical protein
VQQADTGRVTLHTFLLVLTTASALLAAWIVVRFPRANPAGPRAMSLAILVAALVAVAAPAAIDLVGVPFGALAAIFLVALPGCTYMFLVGAWVMLFVRQAIAPYLR